MNASINNVTVFSAFIIFLITFNRMFEYFNSFYTIVNKIGIFSTKLCNLDILIQFSLIAFSRSTIIHFWLFINPSNICMVTLALFLTSFIVYHTLLYYFIFIFSIYTLLSNFCRMNLYSRHNSTLLVTF